MGKQAKPKQNGSGNNDNRANGKASKKNPGRRVTGSKHTKLTEGQKILMGKGLFVQYSNYNTQQERIMQGKRAKKKDNSKSED